MTLASLALAALQGGLLPAFPSGWVSAPDDKVAPTASIAGLEPGRMFSSLGAYLKGFPINREIRFTVSLRAGDADVPVYLAFWAMDADDKKLKEGCEPVAVERGKWVVGHLKVVAPPGTKTLSVFVSNQGGKPLELKEPRTEIGGPPVLNVRGGGLLRASAGMPVAGKPGAVTFPIPSPTAEQAPVSFVLHCNPPEALEGYTVRRREGDNWVCEARVAPVGGKAATLRWESLVAVRDLPPPGLARVKIGPVEPSMRGWLAATPVVQADDPAVVAKARELRKGADDLETFVRKVIRFSQANEGTGKPFVSLDAASALACGGSCTSRANLGAALLRAGGVPARTVSHLPIWCYGEPLYEHWLTEYWHPGAGWMRVETTLGEFRPRATGLAVLSTASIEDERATGKAGQFGWIMPGAAWMSGIQGSGGLHPSGSEMDGNANWCRPERKMRVEAVMKAARAAWPRLAMGHPELEELAFGATPDELAKALSGL